jgi:hypothetical protein
MTTPTTPIPQTIEADLIRIRTIKRKHFESLLEPVGTDRGTKPNEVELLAYVHERDAILARRHDNGHLTAIRAISYYSWRLEGLVSTQYATIRDEAYETVHYLPQLFLD